MVNARPGSLDVDRGTWVGVDPTDVMPPALPKDHAPNRVLAEVRADLPSPRPEPVSDEGAHPER